MRLAYTESRAPGAAGRPGKAVDEALRVPAPGHWQRIGARRAKMRALPCESVAKAAPILPEFAIAPFSNDLPLQAQAADHPRMHWTEDGQACSARWRSESGLRPPSRVVIADDSLSADAAYVLACAGTGMLWRGDFHNARQLLQALARRADRKPRKATKAIKAAPEPDQVFNLHRQAQAQRARTLGMLLLCVDADFGLPLRRAPDVRQACAEAYGPSQESFVVSLRELLGLIGAHEWRRKGVAIAALGGLGDGRIHPHYGVFAPVRGEYLELLAQAPLPPALASQSLAFDIGTGTGVLSAVLARRGVQRVVATDLAPRALACAEQNLQRLGLSARVALLQSDLFPPGRAPLVVCNPPWLPARPRSSIEQAVYDLDSRMLRGFLDGLAAHLAPGGEGWLLLSDLAEHLVLRSRADLLAWIEAAGLSVVGRLDVRPTHPKSSDRADPLHAARAAEVTSLWRLRDAAAATGAQAQ